MNKKMEQRIDTYCQQINQECFWEYHMSNSEILKMAQKGSDQEKYFLFTKIIENATDVLKSLRIFNINDQKKMIMRYKPSKFNHKFLEKRHKIVKYFLTGKKVDVPELQWNL